MCGFNQLENDSCGVNVTLEMVGMYPWIDWSKLSLVSEELERFDARSLY